MVEDDVGECVPWSGWGSSDVDENGANGRQLRDSGRVGRGEKGWQCFAASH